jgi:hypothetical protein
MMAVLLGLTPVQRLLRVRRLLREVRGQRALLADKTIKGPIHHAAERRVALATIDLLDELLTLDQGGVLDVVAECFATVFAEDLATRMNQPKAN